MVDTEDKKIKTLKFQSDNLTKEQSAEFIKCASSVYYFLTRYVFIQNPSLGSILFSPRSYQSTMADYVQNNRFVIFNAPRQCGKSAIISGILLWYTIFKKDTRVGILSNKGENAKDIMERLRYAYEEMDWWLKPAVTEYNKLSIVFDNGSKIEAGTTTENAFRGRSFSIIYLDEFAFVKQKIAEEFWTSLLPTITGEGTESKTKLIITSTPNGTEGMYAKLWFGAEFGENGFAYYKVRSEDIPGRDENFKKEMLTKMSLTKYMQEYEGAFLSSKETLVSSMVLESIKTKEPEYTWNDFELYKKESYFKNKRLGMASDVGTGVGADYHTIQVFDIDSLEQVAEFRNNTMTQTDFAKAYIKFIEYMFSLGVKELYYTVEQNSYGHGVLNLLMASKSPRMKDAILVSDKGKNYGIKTTQSTKRKGCATLKDLVESYTMKLNSKKLISELKFFIKAGETGFKAESGMNDDLCMGCVVFCNMLNEMESYDESVFEKMHRVDNDFDVSSEDIAPMPFVF